MTGVLGACCESRRKPAGKRGILGVITVSLGIDTYAGEQLLACKIPRGITKAFGRSQTVSPVLV